MNLAPGKELRSIRERLRLKYRDVEEASQQIALRHRNPEFLIGLSRLADIENKGTVPSIFRMYSLSVIYGLDYSWLLEKYGVLLNNNARDLADLQLDVTRKVEIFSSKHSAVALPPNLLTSLDLRRTTFLNRQLQTWGIIPLHLLQTLDVRNHRYAIVGSDDWSMYPLIPPGSFVQIDESKRRVQNSGWDSDANRPIYLVETRDGARFGWCTERASTLILQPHPSSPVPAEAYRMPDEVEVIGQVVGIAMRLDRAKVRRKGSS